MYLIINAVLLPMKTMFYMQSFQIMINNKVSPWFNHLSNPTSDKGPDLDQIDPEKKLEILICNSANSEGIQGLEIKTAQFIPKDNEIHNTYGELSNSTLLMKYGFCLYQNPFDYVSIDIQLFLTNLENSIKPFTKTIASKFQLLRDTIE